MAIKPKGYQEGTPPHLTENYYENGTLQGMAKKPDNVQPRRQKSEDVDEARGSSWDFCVRVRNRVAAILNDPEAIKYYLMATAMAMVVIAVSEMYFLFQSN